jgi:hypothetical protein
VEASACSVYLIDAKRQQLWSVASDSGREFRIPLDAGIAGAVASTGETINIAGILLCCAVLCRAVPCCAVLCRAIDPASVI